jgi:hypothetical protein
MLVSDEEDPTGLIVLTQRCAPFRLQQAGRFTSELAARANTGEISGRLKTASKTMLSTRRTLPL